MKIKISEATIPQINWLVATLEGQTPYLRIPKRELLQLVWLDDFNTARYATDWAQGGPIIEQEHINHEGIERGRYIAWKGFNARRATWDTPADPQALWQYGSTPLIAAMRCYVASKLGEEVEVPEKLCKSKPSKPR